ncbi:hypothetical protein [uncultured Brevibacillus sp.]|uniref:hypothetical protein n=1 Tax=uncultured Brevibacillus sp. TaxID=169970 RepID=UPI00259548AD|nr:hypothetical protein [uncultured Brevibacillus sp.]
MVPVPGIYYAIFALIFIAGLLLTIHFMKRQESKELDHDVSQSTVKNKVLGNTGMLFYVGAFAVLLAVLLIGIVVYR